MTVWHIRITLKKRILIQYAFDYFHVASDQFALYSDNTPTEA